MPNSAGRADPPIDLDPSTLTEVAAEIEEAFPLVPRRTGLVLFDVDPGHLQAQWQVEQDHLEKAQSAFPADLPDVHPVLRLLRVDGPNDEQEIAALPEPGGLDKVDGTVRFSVSDHGATFLAELGLVSDGGGWILLARSNQVRLPRPVGRRIPVRKPPVDQSQQPVQPPSAFHGVDQSRTYIPLPKAAPSMIGRKGPSADGALAPFDATLADSGARLPPVFPQPSPASAWSPETSFPRVVTVLQALGGDAESVPLPVSPSRIPTLPVAAHGDGIPGSGTAPDVACSPGVLPPPLLPSSSVLGGRSGGLPEFPSYDPDLGVSSRPAIGPSVLGADVEIHAELLVFGRAEPGSSIDLFGQRLRVGADGRFSLRRVLDDPMLLGLVAGQSLRPSPSAPETE